MPARRRSSDGGAKGSTLHIGSGIAYGYATLGAIGFSDRYDYGVVGTVANLASQAVRRSAWRRNHRERSRGGGADGFIPEGDRSAR